MEMALRLDVLASRPERARAYRAYAARLKRAGGRAAVRPSATPAAGARTVPQWLKRDLDELIATGSFDALEDARSAVSDELFALAEAPALGPRVTRVLLERAGARTVSELADVLRGGFLPRVPSLDAMGKDALRRLLPEPPSMLLASARDAGRLVTGVLAAEGALAVVSGDTRRGLERVGELLVLATGIGPRATADVLRSNDDALLVRSVVVSRDEVYCILQGRGPLRVRIVPAEDFALASLAATSDRGHLRWLERHAVGKGGLAAAARGADSEQAIYERLGLPYVVPELRIGACDSGAVVLADGSVRGAFHVHTDWSDGSASIVAMAEAARREGYEYIGISDHSRAAPYANGLDEGRLFDQKKGIQRARRDVRGIEILHGIEVDILPDGTLDLADDVLSTLDFVIASVHTDTRMDRRAMTQRLLRAVQNPWVTMLGHPTGRLLSGKSGYSFDLEAVADAARENDTWMEINANGHRLDLSPALLRRARARGASFAINPDAHSPEGLADVALGECMARRAGLCADSVKNTRGRREMHKLLDERKRLALRH